MDSDQLGRLLGHENAADAVVELHRRLSALGFVCRGSDLDAATVEALQAFQSSRGLPAHGRADKATIDSLLEAGRRLGDRNLYLTAPMQRGEDVTELQLRLGGLGFDAGRVDGIFGPDTLRALEDFQRNVGLVTDGIVGPESVAAFERLSTKPTDDTPVAVIRERERLRASTRSVSGQRVVLADLGGAASLVAAAARRVRTAGATVVVADHPDPSAQARLANDLDAHVFLAVGLEARPPFTIAYFENSRFVSIGGQRLADQLRDALSPTLAELGPVCGQRTPLLRETRMPAVTAQLGPARHVVVSTASVIDGLLESLDAWFADPVDGDSVEPRTNHLTV